MLPQRLLLHDPSAAVVLSATLWGGVGALNTNSITDITRHPFVTTASVPPTASSSSIPQSLKSAIAMNSRAAGRPITALCTQLIDLKKTRTDSVTDSLEDGACFCGVLSQDTIQIFSRNWTVHIFKFHDDLQSIMHDREHLIVPLEASGRYFALLKTLVGFGLGRGGSWTRVGYIAAGAAARGSSPFSLSGTHWKGIGAELDMSHMNKSSCSMAGRAESSASHTQPPSSSSSSSSSSLLSHVHPMETALHLFESLSSLPDIPILKISGPKTLSPSPDSSFSSSSGSGSGMQGSASRSGGSGFGFGFGNMSSKPRPAVIVAEDDSLRPDGTSTSAEVETARAAFCTALTARFQGLFQFCHAAAVQTLLNRQAQNSRMSSGNTQYYSELAALSVLSLNPIDGDGDGEGEGEGDAYADVIDEDDHTKADGAVEVIIELCDFLRPTVCSLLRARTPEEAALVVKIFEMFAVGRSPRDIARALNRDHVAGPRGHEWRDTTIRGHGGRGTGILRNELYIGRLVWNRQTFVRDPSTGKRLSRANPREQWIEEEVPELRIVPQQLWDKVQARLQGLADSPTSKAIKAGKFWLKRRPRHVLTGLVACGHCGDSMAVIGRDYLRCSRAHRSAGCGTMGLASRNVRASMYRPCRNSASVFPSKTSAVRASVGWSWRNRLNSASATVASPFARSDCPSR